MAFRLGMIVFRKTVCSSREPVDSAVGTVPNLAVLTNSGRAARHSVAHGAARHDDSVRGNHRVTLYPRTRPIMTDYCRP